MRGADKQFRESLNLVKLGQFRHKSLQKTEWAEDEAPWNEVVLLAKSGAELMFVQY